MKRIAVTIATWVALSLPLSGCMNQTSVAALGDVFKAATLTDSAAKEMAAQATVQMDKKNPVLPANHPYSRRLAKIVAPFKNEDGLALDFKVYGAKTSQRVCDGQRHRTRVPWPVRQLHRR